MSTGEALYLYGVVSGAVPELALGAIGLDNNEVVAVSETTVGLTVLAHAAPARPYQGPEPDVRRWVLEHTRVVERAWDDLGTVLPMTFNVLVSGADGESAETRVRQWLRRAGPALSTRLAAVHGRAELWVEIELDPSAVDLGPELRRQREELAQNAPGLRRLLGKRLEQRQRHGASQLADILYPEYRRRILSIAEEVAERRTRHTSAETAGVSVLSVAVLVPRSQVDALGAELSAIQQEQPGVRVQFLGPWPPYSFSELPPP